MASNKKQNKQTNASEEIDEVEGTPGAVAGSDVGATPHGVEFDAADPGSNMPSFVPGKNWEEGQTLAGRFIRTDRVYSNKFKAGKTDPVSKKKYRDLHVLEDMSNNILFGIWSVGMLGNYFDQVPSEAPVSITYTGLGDKPLQEGQSCPHTFEYKLAKGFRLQRRGAVNQTQATA